MALCKPFEGIICIPLINPASRSSCIHWNHLDSPLPQHTLDIMNIPPNQCWRMPCWAMAISCFELAVDPEALGRTFQFWKSLHISSVSSELSLYHAFWTFSFVANLQFPHLCSDPQCVPVLHIRATMLGESIGLGCLLVHSFHKCLLLAACKKDTVSKGGRDDRCPSLIYKVKQTQR